MARTTVPLGKRWWDVGLALVLGVFLVIALTVDVISALSPIGRDGVPGVRPETLDGQFPWIPEAMKANYLWWCDLCDPAFCYNPAWMKAMAWISPFLYVPLYLVAIPALLAGREWIREPLLMWSWGMFLILSVILYEEKFGEHASHNFPVVFAGNAPYWFFPLILIYRLYPRHPFTVKSSTKNKKH